mgnify:CR=1 FL=1
MDPKNVKLTFPDLVSATIQRHGQEIALAYVDDNHLTYADLSKKIDETVNFLKSKGIKEGDKVALWATSSPDWGIVYLSITWMGAIVVPLLPDFSPTEVKNILLHSEAKLFFVSQSLYEKLDEVTTVHLRAVYDVNSFQEFYVEPAFQEEIVETKNNYQVQEDDLAAIIYTSGTTGKSKGVMLTHKNICFTAIKASIIQPVEHTDKFLSILPLSHTYENTLGFILPLIKGAAIYYLKQTPSPSVLLPAMQKVKPTVILSVPLIMEKIYRNKILPTFESKTILRKIYHTTPGRKLLHKVAGGKLKKQFGGKVQFFGIGGAKLDFMVEQFLKEAGFPYAIGYGMTESSPLLAGTKVSETKLGTTGFPMEGVTLKIHEPDTNTGEGEIWAKGPNVMKGYYKDKDATSEVLTEDGWLRTGDLGVFDQEGFLHIKGRQKNMIVGSSGENIYPEEIESIINNFKHVVESLVLEKKGKLVAMVHFNVEELKQTYHSWKDETEAKLEEWKKELTSYVNNQVNRFSRLHQVVVKPEPFEKTATKKIKRFLYKE